jgi:hypothetical protein
MSFSPPWRAYGCSRPSAPNETSPSPSSPHASGAHHPSQGRRASAAEESPKCSHC